VFLKRIVLHGFKSFADRTEFEFGPGITSIVGPNGCGKSNVVDAVRWVLGEQSARSLRGERMIDVIFAGSRSRKPANAAQVELTFDNRSRFLATDQLEVTVGRTLYRNGQSEYRLNGELCRRKDIRHLLLGTGVGVDAYSIIEQGRIDSLLQADPVQRREVFEEAAGISRYKVQRSEAQRKLERTQNNLLRLNDVIGELERQLRSLKLAASKARRWQEYDARLRELRASFCLSEYHELEKARQCVHGQLAAHQDALQAEQVKLAAAETQIAESEHVLLQLDEEVRRAGTQLTELRSEQSALAERVAQARRRLEDLALTRDRRQAQAAEIAAQLAELERKIAEQTAALEGLGEQVQRSCSEAASLSAACDQATRQRDDSRRALEQARSAAFEAVRRSALLHSERENLLVQRQRLAAQIERLAARRGELEGEIAGLSHHREQAGRRLEMLAQHAEQLNLAARQADSELAGLRQACVELDHKIGQIRERRSAVLSRLELLEDMEQRLEGVDRGTQAVLGWRTAEGANAGVLGLVADLLRIDDPRVWALQPILSTFENHVVIADTYAWLGELCRQGELPGPVRVVALDRLPTDRPRASYEQSPGFIARAADWVTCAPQHRDLAEHLLGRVIVVDEFERALALAAGAPAGYAGVTVDGRAVSADGRLTAGAASATPGLISRKAEIRQLREQRDELDHELHRALRRKNEVEARISDKQLQHAELLTQLAVAQKEHAEAHGVRSGLDGELTRLQREASAIDGELHALRRGLTDTDTQIARLAAEAAAAGDIQRDRQTRIEALERELEELEQAVARLSRELAEAQVAAGRAAEKAASSRDALVRVRDEQASLQRSLAAARREAEDAERQIADTQSELAAAQTRQEQCAAQAEQYESEVLRQRERRQAIRLQLEAAAATARAVRERLHQLEGEIHACEMSLRELEVRREGLMARVRDELGVDLAERYAHYQHDEQDWDAVRAEIEELRDRLARLGHVNLEAITELEELSSRYDHLAAQREDLLTSVERLNRLIADLDEQSRLRFAASFEDIRANFHELFRKLFGGGKADILLEDPSRPLECGIEIIARPPGKELQSISLLSGGEKTLAAVALLMAALKSKPSPFVFLDEVDAALDEANTERFNALVQEFLSRSQFVVITHSKRTMQSADALYGVTMEEPGVSKRVSVRFHDEGVRTPNVA